MQRAISRRRKVNEFCWWSVERISYVRCKLIYFSLLSKTVSFSLLIDEQYIYIAINYSVLLFIQINHSDLGCLIFKITKKVFIEHSFSTWIESSPGNKFVCIAADFKLILYFIMSLISIIWYILQWIWKSIL